MSIETVASPLTRQYRYWSASSAAMQHAAFIVFGAGYNHAPWCSPRFQHLPWKRTLTLNFQTHYRLT